jgi:hypothetical protein
MRSAKKNSARKNKNTMIKKISDDKMINIGTFMTLLLLDIKNQIKIFHWQSHSYSEHKTLDKLFDILTDLNDKWVETFMGKYGRIKLEENANLKLINHNNKSVHYYLKTATSKLLKIQEDYFFQPFNSDLSNIFDELTGALNRACYLLTLK